MSLLRQADTKQLSENGIKQPSENGIKQPRIVAMGMAAKWEDHRRVNLPIDHLAISFSTTKATI